MTWLLWLAACTPAPHLAHLPEAAGLPADPAVLVAGPEPMPPAPTPLDTPIAAAFRPAPGPTGVTVAIAVPSGLPGRLLAERIRAAVDPGIPTFVDVRTGPSIHLLVRADGGADLVTHVLSAVTAPALTDADLATALWPHRHAPDAPDPDALRALAAASATRARVAVVVTGPLDPADVTAAISAATEAWPDGTPLPPTAPPPAADRGTRVRQAATASAAATAWLTAWRAGIRWNPGS